MTKRRIHQNKIFKNIALRRECSLVWFYGFKLHIVTDDYGGIIDFMLTPANVHNSLLSKMKWVIKKLYGKLNSDKD